MKVTFPANGKTKCIKIPNSLIANRLSFGILKTFLAFKIPFIFRIKYKHIKPFIKKAKQYKNFEIVNVKTRQGETVIVSL